MPIRGRRNMNTSFKTYKTANSMAYSTTCCSVPSSACSTANRLVPPTDNRSTTGHPICLRGESPHAFHGSSRIYLSVAVASVVGFD